MTTIAFSSHPISHGVTNFFATVKAGFMKARANWKADFSTRQDIAELMAYSDRELNELGLSHSQVKSAVRAGR